MLLGPSYCDTGNQDLSASAVEQFKELRCRAGLGNFQACARGSTDSFRLARGPQQSAIGAARDLLYDKYDEMISLAV